MSFLAPLYFLGALAIAGPLIFHLIRRQPRGEVEFSSLMFLDATPPRLTRRSRLENWPLLLLRCAAILVLAFAFARPFLPIAQSDSVEGVKQAVILLVDQSASMQRSGLWDQAQSRAEEILAQAGEDSLVSVIGFDSEPHRLLSLEESAGMTGETRLGAAREAIGQLSPTWFNTDLGKAIRYAADQAALLEMGESETSSGTANQPGASAVIETRIVLLSDLQSGAAIESLQGYEWPQGVWLDVRSLVPTTRGNVTLRVLPQTSAADSANSARGSTADEVRVQLSQTEDGDTSTFRLRFAGQDRDAATVQVPPGQTRFYSIPLPTPAAVDTATLTVTGDQDSFDNTYHFIRPKRIAQQVVVCEAPPAATDGAIEPRDTLSFYASQLPWSDVTREIVCRVSDWNDFPTRLDPAETPLLILNPSESLLEQSDAIDRYLRRGGRVLIVLDRQPEQPFRDSLATLLEAPELSINEAEEAEYALISAVDFKSSLIAPLSDPGVNDFSNIRIWNHRDLGGLDETSRVTLKLDDGSPLLVSRDFADANGETPPGKLWVLSTGWQPSQSQFALSTKFVPLLLGMLGPNRRLSPDSLIVGEQIEPSGGTGDGEAARVATEPGITSTGGGDAVAVNLDPSESDTPAIDRNRLSEFGAVVSSPAAREQEQTAERALRDVELEARQGWWQWLVLATLGLIGVETVVAARNSSRQSAAT